MGKKNAIRTLRVRRLPNSKFRWKVKIAGLHPRNLTNSASNAQRFETVKETLRGSSKGAVRFQQIRNYRGHDLVTAILLEDKMDLMLLKLVHNDVIGQIYEIKLQEPGEQGKHRPREQSVRRRRNKDVAQTHH